MTRSHFVIIALALAAGVAPQVAQASCSGNACSAFSATATWSSSDKKVNAVLTNKDQAKPMQVKLCITVDSRCNSFDFTLPPRGSITKSVSVSGGAAPAKFAVDVNKAEFAVTQGASPPPSSQASTAAPASGPTTGVDVPDYGKFSYLASAESVVGAPLKKAVASLITAEELELQLMQQDGKLASITQKLESVQNIEADVAANNQKSKGATISARNADTGFELVATMLDYMQNEARGAAANLVISKDDLTIAEDKKRADALMVEAERARQGLAPFINAITFAMDTAKKVASGPEGQASLAVDATNKVMGMFASNPWETEAKKLYAEADALQAKNLAARLKLAADHLRATQTTIARLQPTMQKAMATHDEAWREAKQTYDGSTRGRFQWKNLDAAIPDAQSTIDLARKTTEAAYSARQAAKALERTGSSSNWSTPGDNQRIVTAMYDRSNVIFDRAIKKRQIVELLLKKLEEATAKAKAAL
jgi:hypothetical protein